MNRPFYQCVRFSLVCLFSVWNRLRVFGSENLPAEGGFILAVNHTSYLDPPVLGAAVRRPITFLAKEELFRVRVLGTLIGLLGAMPAAGDADFRTLRRMTRALRRGEIVAVFPEGTRSRTGDISDDVKAGVAFLAHTAQVPIVPCFIDGTDEAMPRGKKGIRPTPLQVYFDRPFWIGESSLDKTSHYALATAEVMDRIKDLRRGAKKH